MAPFHLLAAKAASPRSDARGERLRTETGQPLSLRRRAATQPSPPLLPGPHTTNVRRGVKRLVIASATARPAFSIKLSTGTPDAADAASTARICATVMISLLTRRSPRLRGLRLP